MPVMSEIVRRDHWKLLPVRDKLMELYNLAEDPMKDGISSVTILRSRQLSVALRAWRRATDGGAL